MSLFGNLFAAAQPDSTLFSGAFKSSKADGHAAQQPSDEAAQTAHRPAGRQPVAHDHPAGTQGKKRKSQATQSPDAVNGGVSKPQGTKKPKTSKQQPKQHAVHDQQQAAGALQPAKRKKLKLQAADADERPTQPDTKPSSKKAKHSGQQKQQQKKKQAAASKCTAAAAAESGSDSDPDSDAEPSDDEPGSGSKLSESDSDSGVDQQEEDPPQEQQEQQHNKKAYKLSAEEQAEVNARTLFVGNVPPKLALRTKKLKQLFAQYGKVESVRVRCVPVVLDKKLPKKVAIMKGAISEDRGGGVAYVKFADPAAATAALAANKMEVDGHHLRVDRASAPRTAGATTTSQQQQQGGSKAAPFNPRCTAFVGNLDFKVSEEDLLQAFNNNEQFPALKGAVEAVRVVRDNKTAVGLGFGYVLLKSPGAARLALELNGAELNKRPMRVTACKAIRADGSSSGSKGVAAGKFGPRKGGANGGGGKGPSSKLLGQTLQGRVEKVRGAAGAGAAGKHSKRAAPDWQGTTTKGRAAVAGKKPRWDREERQQQRGGKPGGAGGAPRGPSPGGRPGGGVPSRGGGHHMAMHGSRGGGGGGASPRGGRGGHRGARGGGAAPRGRGGGLGGPRGFSPRDAGGSSPRGGGRGGARGGRGGRGSRGGRGGGGRGGGPATAASGKRPAVAARKAAAKGGMQ